VFGASVADAQVIIYAQPSMEYGTIIAVMDALHAAGLVRMSLAVSVDGKH
jgi:biopolymer transport protein ExbD